MLRLTTAVHQDMLRNAHAALPQEAVGVLGGERGGSATHHVALPNLAGPYAFLADPFAQFEAEQQMKELNICLLAVYHSHPGGGAQLSPLDMAFARRRTCLQVVIALGRPHALPDEVRAYRLVNGVSNEVEVRIEG
ncbi:MAG: Mov34/MPN/PAD-1 family protein [Gemmatimonadota bacterium]